MKKLLLAFLFLSACTTAPTPPPTEQPPVVVEPTPAPTPTPVPVAELSTPDNDKNFMVLPDGTNLSSISVSGTKLSPTKGEGNAWSDAKQASYVKLKTNTEIAYSVRNLSANKIVVESSNSGRRIFGASSSKIFVGGTFVNSKTKFTKDDYQMISDMIVVSSNAAWTSLQARIGGGDANKGREANYKLTQSLGLVKTRGFQGTWGNLHGNELTAAETTQFMQYVYNKKINNAEVLWKIMYACRTGASKAEKYLPSSLYIGGKTGTYDGPTYDSDISKDVTVRVRNHVVTFKANGQQYAIMVLNNTGSDENVALVAGGLYREFIAK